MREIKFKAWDKKYGKMLQGIGILDSVSANGDNNIYYNYKDQKIMIGPAEDFILMQYTGLKDKNGKEIYEGDIIKSVLNKGTGEHSQLAVIDYAEGGFAAKYISSTHPDFIHFTPLKGIQNYWWGKLSEIIGNIYENPELLPSLPEGGEK